MQKTNLLLVLFFLLVSITSCNDETTLPVIDDDQPVIDNSDAKQNRDVDDVKHIFDMYIGSDIVARSTPNYSIEVLTSDKLTESDTLVADTLLYSVKEYGSDKTIIISANKSCEPILAILDHTADFSFDSLATETQSMYLPFILNAVEYNNHSPGSGNTTRAAASKQIIKEVLPKLKVAWTQISDPFNRYTPNKYPAGCVPIAIAQVMTFLRTLDSFDGNDLNWASISAFVNQWDAKFKATEADVIGKFVSYIGRVGGTKYKSNVSMTNTYDALEKIWSHNDPVMGNKVMVIPYTKDRENKVESTLDSQFGIYIVEARSKGSVIGFARGSGHAFVVDGYRKYSDGSSYLHVNYGWGPAYNGYFLSNILNPKWTDDAPEKYPYDIVFYDICVMHPAALSAKIREKDYFLNGLKKDIELIRNNLNAPEAEKAMYIDKMLNAPSRTVAEYIIFSFLKKWYK